MAMPTKSDLQTLDITWRGRPFCHVEAKAGINTQTLDVTWRGLPFFAASAAAAGGFFSRYYYDMISQSKLGS